MKSYENYLKITVEISVENHFKTKIRSGKSEFNLNGLDAAEYPLLPQIEEHHVFKIPTDLLKAHDSTNSICSFNF